jgi:hypothetical protein
VETPTLPEPDDSGITAADIAWRSAAPEPPLDLLMLTTDEQAAYAHSLYEDNAILRAMVSQLLALLHHVEEERRR